MVRSSLPIRRLPSLVEAQPGPLSLINRPNTTCPPTLSRINLPRIILPTQTLPKKKTLPTPMLPNSTCPIQSLWTYAAAAAPLHLQTSNPFPKLESLPTTLRVLHPRSAMMFRRLNACHILLSRHRGDHWVTLKLRAIPAAPRLSKIFHQTWSKAADLIVWIHHQNNCPFLPCLRPKLRSPSLAPHLAANQLVTKVAPAWVKCRIRSKASYPNLQLRMFRNIIWTPWQCNTKSWPCSNTTNLS